MSRRRKKTGPGPPGGSGPALVIYLDYFCFQEPSAPW
jgi:hypothetical protein